MKKIFATILLVASFALAAPTVERFQWDNFGASDSVTGIALKGAYSGAGLGVLRMNAASTAMELATPTGTGAPVNAHNATLTGRTNMDTAAIGTLLASDTSSFKPEMTADTLNITDRATFDYATASTDAVFDANKRLVSNAVTGTGSSVRADGATVSNLTATGTLTASGATTLQSTLAVTGNVSVNTDKFVVTAASGKAVSQDTVVAALGVRSPRFNATGQRSVFGGVISTSDSLYSGPNITSGDLWVAGPKSGILRYDAVTSGTSARRNSWAFGNGVYVEVGEGGLIRSGPSMDALVTRTSGTSEMLNSVIWVPRVSRFIAVGGAATILTSPDGEAWTPQSAPISPVAINSVADNGTRTVFVTSDDAVSSGTLAAYGYSTDLENWTAEPMPNLESNRDLNIIIWSGHRFYAGNSQISGTRINSSLDGITWVSPVVGGGAVFALTHNADWVFAYNNNTGIWRAANDGSAGTWSNIADIAAVGSGGLGGRLFFANGALHLVGNSGLSRVSFDDGATWQAGPSVGVTSFIRFGMADPNNPTRAYLVGDAGVTRAGVYPRSNLYAGNIFSDSTISAARFVAGTGTSIFDTAKIDVLDVGEITGAGLFGDSLTVDSALVLANLSANSPLYLDGNNEVKTGTWSGTGTVIPTTQGATLNNPTLTGTVTAPTAITMGSNTFTRSGEHNLTLTTGATTNVTLPASGTLATLAGTETLSNKTLDAPTLTGTTTAGRIESSDTVVAAGLRAGSLTTTGNITGRRFVTNGTGTSAFDTITANVLDIGTITGGSAFFTGRIESSDTVIAGILRGGLDLNGQGFLRETSQDRVTLSSGEIFFDGTVHIVDSMGLNVRKIFGDTTEIATTVTIIGPGTSASGSTVNIAAESAYLRGTYTQVGPGTAVSGSVVSVVAQDIQFNADAAQMGLSNSTGNMDLTLSGTINVNGNVGVTGTCSSVSVVKGIVVGCTP